MKVYVSGASGFIGKRLVYGLKELKYSVVEGSRKSLNFSQLNNTQNLIQEQNLKSELIGCDVVFHLAARVHIMDETDKNPLDEFRKVNVTGTRFLANIAASAGVKRFVYISSIKVNGDGGIKPYTELDTPHPSDDYGISKWEAELALQEVSAKTGLEVVIIRPPLVYGAGVKGNFAQMIKCLASCLPLPFASVKNLRSFIFVDNLVDALILCANHPSAAGQTYLVCDGDDVSTPDLLRKLSVEMGKRATLISCSPVLIRIVGKLFGKSLQVGRLLGSLQVDSSKIRRELGWQPPFSLNQGLKLSIKDLIDDKTLV